ncbi:hypothetical protein RHMOL_Rhmol07G0210000 [Rhododendron molle]|uniref:Uncharacterized protein n=1 Tax=Rhododendron molle TaxID=49168 RepID=A0ACC0N2Z0_RHOML|nr:hypothetical protein RHMOL_Rhmol07G0210000 [Rhododendron molle]
MHVPLAFRCLPHITHIGEIRLNRQKWWSSKQQWRIGNARMSKYGDFLCFKGISQLIEL